MALVSSLPGLRLIKIYYRSRILSKVTLFGRSTMCAHTHTSTEHATRPHACILHSSIFSLSFLSALFNLFCCVWAHFHHATKFKGTPLPRHLNTNRQFTMNIKCLINPRVKLIVAKWIKAKLYWNPCKFAKILLFDWSSLWDLWKKGFQLFSKLNGQIRENHVQHKMQVSGQL